MVSITYQRTDGASKLQNMWINLFDLQSCCLFCLNRGIKIVQELLSVKESRCVFTFKFLKLNIEKYWYISTKQKTVSGKYHLLLVWTYWVLKALHLIWNIISSKDITIWKLLLNENNRVFSSFVSKVTSDFWRDDSKHMDTFKVVVKCYFT